MPIWFEDGGYIAGPFESQFLLMCWLLSIRTRMLRDGESGIEGLRMVTKKCFVALVTATDGLNYSDCVSSDFDKGWELAIEDFKKALSNGGN